MIKLICLMPTYNKIKKLLKSNYKNMKNYLVRLFESALYASSFIRAIFFLVCCIVNIIDNWYDLQEAFQITSTFGAAFTISATVYTFISKEKSKRLEYSINLVKDFDRTDFREARNLTRLIEKPFKEGKITSKDIAFLVNYNVGNKNIISSDDEKRYKKIINCCCGKKDKFEKLQESVIVTFNYWSTVYSAIKYNAANKKYLKQHLSNIYVSQYKRLGFG